MTTINDFRGKYEFLSNFYYCPVEVGGVTYRTNEHAFQALKTNFVEERLFVAAANTPSEAKRRGRQVTMRPDWNAGVRDDMMFLICSAKFSLDNPEMMRKLHETGDAELVEGNYWHDIYWGRCTCSTHRGRGANALGAILMRIREHNASIIDHPAAR